MQGVQGGGGAGSTGTGPGTGAGTGVNEHLRRVQRGVVQLKWWRVGRVEAEDGHQLKSNEGREEEEGQLEPTARVSR